MSRSEKDRLVLSSRYIHTGNSGVTLTLRRDVERVDRAELEVENGAFGAFRTSMLVRGNDFSGMTSIQLRDLALMFLDAADSLDNECKAPLRQGGYTSLLGSSNEAYLVPEGGGRRSREAPQSLRRYIPNELSGLALDPGVDFTPFARLYHEQTRKGGDVEVGHTESEEALPPAQARLKKQKEREGRQKRLREDFIRHTGWDYLMAKRLSDLVAPFFERTQRDFLNAENVKFTLPDDEQAG